MTRRPPLGKKPDPGRPEFGETATETVSTVPEQGTSKRRIETTLAWAGIAVGIIAIIVSVTIYFLQRTTKALEYEVFSGPVILNAGQFRGKGIQVSLNGVALHDPHLVVLIVRNNGNVPIKRDDFEKPLRVEFPGNNKILSAEVAHKDPEDLQVSLDVKQKFILIRPLLLNDKDWMVIQVLIDGSSNPQMSGRIAGVHSIQKSELRTTSSRGTSGSSGGSSVGLVVLGLAVGAGISIASSALLLRNRRGSRRRRPRARSGRPR
jgi:hypothetical protein